MRISELDNRGNNFKVLLLQTPSSQLSIFLKDKMKLKYQASADSTIEITSKSQYKNLKELVGIFPFFAEKWFVEVNLDKMHDKELYNIIKDSTTCFFFCTCSRYSLYKSTKEKLKDVSIADFYINYLSKPDFVYLYDALTREDNKLDNALFNYVIQSYSGDVDSVIDLFLALNRGVKFKNRKDIAEVCGLGGNTIESYLFSLLKPVSGSDRGLKIMMNNRIYAGLDLGNTLGWTRFYNYLSNSISNMCELKVLLMQGVIYRTVKNLPDNFDENKLARYQKYLWRIREIKTSSLLKIREQMGYKVWRNDADFLRFIYGLYMNNVFSVLGEDLD